ncbi:ATP-dependent DNA helicase PcrA [Thalassoglobus neptunius]|uniref:DNA 3'-5' helicase n=1 Tax=Thalassoglobus neptunius TaxID=1938619 RepID=A0A5C5VY68_9PLAN|nr:UvrD-helicase domain-containing protein [Thalassoglobus neptunius]TWT43087.1 ATP-dependent DNA helicase PcrA [Thalassoglobus neptunius]
MNVLSDGLTDSQAEAVHFINGPLLIVAGPGSGKTRVVTRRIANLVMNANVHPRNLLAITFTNKAAKEMGARVEALLPGQRIWVSTFHRFCARILREYGDVVGIKSSFSILDTSDQKQLLRIVLNDLDFDTVHFSPEKVLWRISDAKNDLITPENFNERFDEGVSNHWDGVVRKAYPAYQKALLESNAVDFDDLLMHVALMLAEQTELCRELAQRYRYILVDEYQDTNSAQYQIVAALAQHHQNLCVTGDPDQSIYGWRGARIENILRFERDFPTAQTIRLEQNFRSTGLILRSADSLIACNRQLKAKKLFTAQADGEPVRLLIFPDSRAEAAGIAQEIRDLVDTGDYQWSDVAIFYRVNALSRQVETALMRHRVPFQVASGVAFYDRAEIKDLLAYLRLVENPLDHTAFLRIVNKPLRGLGKTSQNRLLRWAQLNHLTPLEACVRASEVPKLSKRAIVGFRRFAEMINGFSLAGAGSVGDLLVEIIDKTYFVAPWQGSPNEADAEKVANVEELVAAARQYDEALGDDRSLQGFLEQTALISETDFLENTSGQVSLMSLHAAKGLEFPIVFVLGLEEGLIPHERSLQSESRRELEEERRLLFVGMTRAEERLYLTESRIRSMHGRTVPTIESPFIRELECERIDVDDTGEFAATQWQQPVPESKPTPGLPGIPKLMTGASLLNGEKESVDIPIGFRIGMLVRHPRYGRGTVTDVSGYGGRRTVTVHFSGDDKKETFVASKAPLQPLGE